MIVYLLSGCKCRVSLYKLQQKWSFF